MRRDALRGRPLQALLVSVLAVLGCVPTEPATAIVVVIDSDLPAGALARIEIATLDAAGAPIAQRSVDVAGGALPFSFSVAPRSEDLAPLRIEVRGFASGGLEPRIVRRAIAPFVRGETRRLVIYLDARCDGVACDGADRTCAAGACVDAHVPASALEPIVPGEELAHDAGPHPIDAQDDAATDARIATDAQPPPDAPPGCAADPRCDAPTDVAVGARHVCARRESETLVCWGDNDLGQLGDGTLDPRATPSEITSLFASDVVAGDDHTCLVAKGQVHCWGANDRGQLGDGDLAPARPTPQPVPLAGGSLGTYATPHGACIISITGEVGRTAHCWGAPFPGISARRLELCGVVPCARTPLEQPSLMDAGGLAVSAAHACIVRDGIALCAGENAFGEIGDGSHGVAREDLVRVEGLAEATAIAVGDRTSCALTGVEGRVVCWGANDLGQLGTGAATHESCGALPAIDCAPAPVSIGASDGIAEIAGTGATFCARDRSGTVRCWGADDAGALGDGGPPPPSCTAFDGARVPCSRAPVEVAGVDDAIDLDARGGRFCAVRAIGSVVCWGAGSGAVPVELPLPPRPTDGG